MKQGITILTVNWYSSEMIRDLIVNLNTTCSKTIPIQYLIIDNTNGSDTEITELSNTAPSVKILKKNPGNLKNLRAHAAGLNYGLTHIKTEFLLITDPDIYIFKNNWDTFLIEESKESDLDAIGTAFPSWWLGTYHNFPSPIFCFIKTAIIQKTNENPAATSEIQNYWMPPPKNPLIRFRNLILRQILRAAFLFNRRTLIHYPFFRILTSYLEKKIPVCTLDTGYPLSRKADKENWKIKTFEAIYPDSKIITGQKNRNSISKLAEQYELYVHNSEIILTHQYGSQNFLLKTKEGKNRDLWKQLIKNLIQNPSSF